MSSTVTTGDGLRCRSTTAAATCSPFPARPMRTPTSSRAVATATRSPRSSTRASSPGPRSAPVEAGSLTDPAAPLVATVAAGNAPARLDRIWRMVGSERLSQLREGDDGFGNAIGPEFHAALAKARAELGVERVRAHAILHDDLGVFTWSDGGPRWSFEQVDRVYDQLLELGIRPVVEVSFMPRDLARDPDATVFEYRGDRLAAARLGRSGRETCGRLAAHLVERYGVEEVAGWGFEIWNEPNLQVFWTGTQAEYFRLYDEAARAIKAVDERLPVGGPATAASEWIEDFTAFAETGGVPVDFVSTHTYGNDPLDLHALARSPRARRRRRSGGPSGA